MKSTKLLLVSAIALAAAAAAVVFAVRPDGKNPQQAHSSRHETLYTCGMHPQVIQDHPGNCPICGMKLTPMTPTAGGSEILIDPVTIQNMGIRTSEVIRGPLRHTVRTVGVIDYNETMLAEVTTKYTGWIEKLYVDANGQQVHRGDPLFEIYSPELYSAQTEYLLATGNPRSTNDPAIQALLQSARQKLRFFDISDAQIAELDASRKATKTLPVLAPIDGFAMEKTAVEGMMVQPGMKLYRLADLGIVWVYAQVYEQDLPYVKLGQEATVTLSYLPGRTFRGRVTYVYPDVNEKTRTARVRMEFHNPGFFLKPGMFASVRVSAELNPSALLVPDSAVLRSGEKDTVFVALEGGKFEPRSITIGPRAEGDRYQVISGLNEGERVVTSGQFMLDSESHMREAIQKMLNPRENAGLDAVEPIAEVPGSSTGTTRTNGSAAERPAKTRTQAVTYICPMPEHVSIEYDHPGKCPLCGMTLVPVSPELLSKIQPGGRIEAYTCPMPEHDQVRSEKPGKCPLCGMTLIPVMTKPADLNEGEAVAREAAQSPLPTLYTCPMASHAHVVSDKPGKCPECEMDLVKTSSVPHGTIAEAQWRKEHAPEGN